MKIELVTENDKFKKILPKLFNESDEFSIAVAWASMGPQLFDLVLKHEKKAHRVIVGTHFYQTDPSVIDCLVDSNYGRISPWTSGVFHPKIYKFRNSENWSVLIGSANFTNGPIVKNFEATALVKGDHDEREFIDDISYTINTYWDMAVPVSQEYATNYKSSHDRKLKHLKKLSGQYGSSGSLESELSSTFMTMDWSDFLTKMKEDPFHSFKKRLEFLSERQEDFRKYKSFKKMPSRSRQMIAGTPVPDNTMWGWFGSMKARGNYKKAINQNNKHISNALNIIPNNGIVTRDQYFDFVNEYQKAFPEANELAGATRLLCIKRPDQFITFNKKNSEIICDNFDISKSNMTYERYWDEIIERVLESRWWNSKKPTRKKDRIAWQYRTAMLDAISYKE